MGKLSSFFVLVAGIYGELLRQTLRAGGRVFHLLETQFITASDIFADASLENAAAESSKLAINQVFVELIS